MSSKVKVKFLKNLLKTDEVINDMKDSIKRNLDAQLEIQRKTRQTLQGNFLNFWHGVPNWCVLDSAIVQDEGHVNEWEIASEFMNNFKAI